jgi:hypothetical protein
MANIMEIIIRIIWAIVGGAISIAFIFGSLGALGYMIYYFFKYGKNAFVNEFLVK